MSFLLLLFRLLVSETHIDSRSENFTEGPLSRADFWAFELRRQMLDVGERVDFIILYTRDGTFKLKRSPTTTIPVEFAREFSTSF